MSALATCPICAGIILHNNMRCTGTFGGSAEVTARCPKCKADVLFGYVDVWHVKDEVAHTIADECDDDSSDPFSRTMPRICPVTLPHLPGCAGGRQCECPVPYIGPRIR